MDRPANRLTVFLPSLRGGGVEKSIVVLCRGLAEAGLNIDLVLSKAEGSFLAHVPEAVRIINLEQSHVSSSVPAFVKYLRSERPTHLLSAMNYVNILAILANELAGRPAHLIIREDSTPSVLFDQGQGLKNHLIPYLMRLLYRRADTVLAVSEGVADDLAAFIGLPRNRIQVIGNPIVDEELNRQMEEALPAQWQHLETTPLLLGVGRLSREKNFADLLRAFAMVSKAQRDDLTLVILGEGPERHYLEELAHTLGIADKVEMPGFVDNPYAFMRRARVFVLSSRFEGLPTVLIEAMACGCPVVSTDCPSGPREILLDGKLGPLVPVDDIRGLADAIEATLKAPVSLDLLKARAEDFSTEAVADRYLDLLLTSSPS